MKHTPMITLSKGGTGERTVKLETLQIPDCYGIAQNVRQKDEVAGKMVNECWHIAHDLKRHALEVEESKADLLAALDRITHEQGQVLNSRAVDQALAAIAKARGE